MENLSRETITNKKEKNYNKESLEKEENINNSEEDEKDGEFSTNFAENFELTEEEKNLRKNYLKKLTKKEALWRSIVLGKKKYFLKVYTFFMEILNEFISIKDTKYKAEAINSITSKNLDNFISCIKYQILLLFIQKIIHKVDENLINIIFEKFSSQNIMLENFLFNKDIEFFDLYKTGELYDKVNENEDYPYFNIFDTLSQIVKHIFKIFYFGYYLFMNYFEMSIIYTIIIIAQNAFQPYISSFYSNTEELVDKHELRMNYINEILANIRLIKSFGTEKKELRRVNNVNAKLKSKSLFYQIIQELYDSLYNANEIFSLYICGVKTITGKMDYGELLIFEKYSGEFSSGVSSIKRIYSEISDGIDSWLKFLQFYDIDQKIVSRKNIIPESKDKVNEGLGIIFKNVSFSYPSKKSTNIINDFNLEINPGKTIAIVGSSGSGKTTLTNLILRFYDVDNGEILINGVDIRDIDLTWLRSKIGIVSQEPVLTSGTIRENILYGVENYTEKKFIEICKLANVYSFATDKKLFPKQFDTIVGERGIKVSGGQKQRIAIARALMKDAKILIFDEATSALDSENEAMVQEAINNIINQKKITSIIIAHRLSTVKNADIIMFIDKGRIVEMGSHEELILKNGEYKKLVQKQLIS